MAEKGVPTGELLRIVGVLQKLKSQDEDNRFLAAELRSTLLDGKKRLRPLMRKIISHLRQTPPLLTYIGFPLEDYVERAERTRRNYLSDLEASRENLSQPSGLSFLPVSFNSTPVRRTGS